VTTCEPWPALAGAFHFGIPGRGNDSLPCPFDLQADLGTTVMTRKRADEYRRLAHECLIAARRMSQGSDRDTLIRMAQVWERLAGEQ
jgi:hypothetical protein